jgi:hypothetical protein
MTTRSRNFRKIALSSFFLSLLSTLLNTPGAESDYSKWKNGPGADPNFFPIAVWVQQPKNAEKFKAAGINTYVGLWRGPTAEQLSDLQKAGMKLVCSQNKLGLENKENPIIIAWMHGDEPDNAQPLRDKEGYGPPILPSKIQEDYEKLRAADPSRPILLNLGQGVAYDNYIGRGVRRNHMEDYPEYIKGCDIVSFDIYPVVHDKPEIAGKLEYVALGVERLRDWSKGEKIVWNCVECTHISNPPAKATPAQVKSEVWMSLIHGSKGLIYFVHQFKPTFIEAGLLADPEMLKGVTEINRQIHDLAPVLNAPNSKNPTKVESSNAETPIALMTKEHSGATYIFAVAMRNHDTTATFTVPSATRGQIEVLGENRTLKLTDGIFSDSFTGYQVHLYRLQRQ